VTGIAPKSTILVIDDDTYVLVFLRTVLGYQLRHEILTASDGVAGIWTYEQTRPDLVIVDLMMPYLGGVHVIEHLTAHYPDVKIIAMSGKAPDQLGEAEGHGAMASLRKPLDRDDLVAAVERGLGL